MIQALRFWNAIRYESSKVFEIYGVCSGSDQNSVESDDNSRTEYYY